MRPTGRRQRTLVLAHERNRTIGRECELYPCLSILRCLPGSRCTAHDAPMSKTKDHVVEVSLCGLVALLGTFGIEVRPPTDGEAETWSGISPVTLDSGLNQHTGNVTGCDKPGCCKVV